jgi:two-component system cell cycle sensor histidine kinase/response regulator CckA
MTISNDNLNPIPRAVVVNDDATQLNVLCGLLQKAGIQPVPFNSAETALAAMSQDAPPALIITDLYMPGIDGWRFCRLLRSPEYVRFNHTPILVVSATFSGDEPSRITSDLGANAFLSMPVDGQQFFEQTHALLKGENPHDLLKVLVVEASKLVSKRLVEAFQAHGYQADAAFNYQEGLTRIGQITYDIAVLDYPLPGDLRDGLLKHLREKSPDCVCIMMTAASQPELALTWMKMGAAAYLPKPFEPEYLIAQCERARRERALLRVQDLLEVRTRQLQESEEKYRGLIHYSSDPIFAFNPDETYRYVNEAFARPFGKKPVEIIGKTPHAIFPHAEAEKRLTLVRQVLQTGERGEIEVKVITHTGEERYYLTLADPVKDDQGKVIYITCISKDITERKQIEEALRKSYDLITGLAEQVPGVVYQYRLYSDGRSSFPYASPGMQEIYEVTPEEVREDATPVFGRLHPEDYALVVAAIQESARSLQLFHVEFRVVLPRQGLRWRLSNAKPQRTEDGGTLWYGIISDVTDRKMAEMKINEQLDELRRWHNITMGREDRILELKSQVNRLLAETGKPPRYASAEEAA